MTDPIHIVGLKADNIQRLVAVDLELKPEGGVVEIRGPNGAGKTTLLNCLQMAFAGASAVGRVPLRDGAESGEIEVRTSNGLVITRRFTGERRTYLDVRDANDAAPRKPQKLLDRLLGPAGTLDPHEFMLLPAGKQADRLRELTGIDTREVDLMITQRFEERADANREVRLEEARLEDMPEITAEHGNIVEVPLEELDRQIQEAIEHNASVDAMAEKMRLRETVTASSRERLEALISNVEDTAQRHSREIEELAHRQRSEIDSQEKAIAEAREALERDLEEEAERKRAMQDFQPIDVDVLREHRTALLEQEAVRKSLKARTEQEQRVEGARMKAANLTGTVEELRKARLRMISEADMPVPGLGFDESGMVTFNDLPFEQAAHSEQLRVSLAIAMALQPELRVILFSDASLLDKDSIAIVHELAGDRGYQVLAEFVDSTPGETGIFIWDGHVTHIDGKAVEEEGDE